MASQAVIVGRVPTASAATSPRVAGDRVALGLGVMVGAVAIRDTLGGMLRWSLSLSGLDVLWFIPDLFIALCAIWFVWSFVIVQRSPWGALLIGSLLMSVVIGFLYVSREPAYVTSSIKMFLPLVAGAALANRNVTDLPLVRTVLTILLFAAIGGVWWSYFVRPPWIGYSFELFGVEKSAGKLWWIQRQERFGGFAQESTIAAATALFILVLLHRHFGRIANLALWALTFSAITLTTSRSAQVAALAFLAYLVVAHFMTNGARSIGLHRRVASWSYALAVAPFVFVIVLAGARLEEIALGLRSFQIRIDEGWQVPFTWLWNDFPASIVMGCGLGCFTYPMKQTNLAAVMVPIDNFYLASFIMFGFPFVMLCLGFVLAAMRGDNRTKLLLAALLNVYLVTVEGYAPSFITMLIGYAASDLFSFRSRGAR